MDRINKARNGRTESDFYYDWRYKKFEGKLTTDGKSIDGTDFLPQDRLSLIDNNLGYKQFDMYMDSVINQIKTEFENFRDVMIQHEYANIDYNLPEEEQNLSSCLNMRSRE